MTLITIIGRGHGGTRAMSHTLQESGVFMGEPLNVSGDLLPPQALYEACRVMGRYVTWKGGLEWDFNALHTMDIPKEFTELVESYLVTVRESTAEQRGWKIPETTLIMPWIVRMFPEILYIHWVRDPRDNILAQHKTDDLHDFGVDYPEPESFLETLGITPNPDTDHEELMKRLRRAISWQYQHEIVKATPTPTNWTMVRFEDFVLHQEATLTHLEAYLGFPLARIPVRPETVGRWRTAEGIYCFDFLTPAMQEFGYELA